MIIRTQFPCGEVRDYRVPNQFEVKELKISVRVDGHSIAFLDLWNNTNLQHSSRKGKLLVRLQKRFSNNQNEKIAAHLCLLRMGTGSIATASVLCICNITLFFSNFLDCFCLPQNLRQSFLLKTVVGEITCNSFSSKQLLRCQSLHNYFSKSMS